MFQRLPAIHVLAGLALLLVATAPVLAQTDIEVNAAIQFNFSTPGARSLGLGGAFLGLADDATAAYTNPAGLTNLSRPEVSAEFRSWDYTHVFTNSGNTGEASQNGIDTISGLREGDATDSVSGASFASFVYPGKSWAVAAYRHELARFEANIQSQGAFISEFDSRYFPVKSFLDLEIVGYGVAGAFRFGEAFSVGVGAVRYSFDFSSRTDRFGFTGSCGGDPDRGGFYEPPCYDLDNRINYQLISGDDDDVAFQGGFLWSGEKFSIGGVYRQGPEFAFTGRNLGGTTNTLFQEEVSTFHVPDVFGIGFAVHPTDAWTISLDVDRVTYSNLAENTLNVIGCDASVDPTCSASDTAAYDASAAKLDVDDATEIHLGVEYVFVNLRYPLGLRFGGYTDPDHRIAMNGADPTSSFDAALAGFFRQGDDDVHYSFGLGMVFGERFQLDGAADFSDRVDTLALSGVFRF